MQPGSAPLVGRERELHALLEILEEVVRGQQRIVLIEGEPGIGKTRLLGEALSVAAERQVRAFVGRAEELERDRPFGAFAEALQLRPGTEDPQRAELTALLLGEVALSPGSGRFRIVEGVVSLVERLAATGPILLALEDVHWADPSTLLAALHVARRLAHVPLAFLLTSRFWPRSPELDRLVEELDALGARRIELSPLEDGAVERLVATLSGGVPPEPALLQRVAHAGGNPLFVTELVSALAQEAPETTRNASGTAAVVPPSLRLAILRRLRGMSEPTVAMLRLASVLGASFDPNDLCIVTGTVASDVAASLQEASSAGIVSAVEDRMAFRHDVVREAVYQEIDEPVRAALHLQVARALASAGAPAVRVATHMSLGASVGDEEAARWLLVAAREVAGRAPATAVALLERGLELAPTDSPGRDEMEAELVTSLLWSGRLGDAEARAREVLARDHDPVVGGALRRVLGRVLVYEGRVDDSIAQIEQALATGGMPDPERARLFGDLALRRPYGGDLSKAREEAEQAIALGRRVGDRFAESTGLCALSWIAGIKGEMDLAIDRAERALGVASSGVAEAAEPVQPRIYLSLALAHADRLEEALEIVRDGQQLAEETGAAWSLPLLLTIGAHAKWIGGRWDEAVADAETALALAQEVGVWLWSPRVRWIMARIAFHRGDIAAAETALDAAEGHPTASGGFGAIGVKATRALLLEAAGELDASRRLADGAWAQAGNAGFPGEGRWELAHQVVRVRVATGDDDGAAEGCREAERYAAVTRMASARAASLRCSGLVLKDPDQLLECVAEYRASPRAYDLASACEDAGIALLAGGRNDEAQRVLDEAMVGYERVDATRDIARLESAFRHWGIRRGRRGTRERPATGWDSLTPTEQRVVSLAAEGLTNPAIGRRLFISRRTVETHLSHVFAKLGVSSRVELAAKVAQRRG